MKVRWLRDATRDPSLKGITRLLEEGGTRKFVRDLSAVVPLPGTEIVIEPVKQRIGQRAVLRVDAGDGSRFYVKFVRGSGGEERAAALAAIARSAGPCGVEVPLPVAWLPRFRALVTTELRGVPLLESCMPDDLALLGRSLAALHARFPRPTLVRGRSFERLTLADVLGRYRRTHPGPGAHPGPDIGLDLEREMEGWIGSDPVHEERLASLHGDLYPEQVLLLAGNRIGILDWDNACAGEPERDAGNLVAHLILEEERRVLHDSATRIHAFLSGYASAGELRPAVLTWYSTGSLLRIAILHADATFGSRPPNEPDLPARLLLRARNCDRDLVARWDAADGDTGSR